jgi:hypothetical protein
MASKDPPGKRQDASTPALKPPEFPGGVPAGQTQGPSVSREEVEGTAKQTPGSHSTGGAKGHTEQDERPGS